MTGEKVTASTKLNQEISVITPLLAQLDACATELAAAIIRLNSAHEAVTASLGTGESSAAVAVVVASEEDNLAPRADGGPPVAAEAVSPSQSISDLHYDGVILPSTVPEVDQQSSSSSIIACPLKPITDSPVVAAKTTTKSHEILPAVGQHRTESTCAERPKLRHLNSSLGEVRMRKEWCDVDADLLSSIEKSHKWEVVRRKMHGKLDSRRSSLSTVALELTGIDQDTFYFPVAHPGGVSRLIWNGLCLALITWDVLTIPMQVFAAFQSTMLEVVEWFSTILWTFDLLFNFRTGYFVGTKLEMRPKVVAWRYLTTWFVLDVFLVFMEWFGRFTSIIAPASIIRTSRILRTLRFIKLVRLAKMQNLWVHVKEQINSNTFHLMFNMTLMTFALMICVHIIACAWYALGSSRNDGWIGYDAYQGPKGLFFWYLASSRWVIAQVNGRTDIDDRRNMPERGFTCLVGVTLAVIAKAIFTSVMTKTMLELSQLTSEKTRRRRLVNAYLETHQLSSTLTTKVKRYLQEYQDPEREYTRENQVLAILPRHVKFDLLTEVRAPRLVKHPLFRSMSATRTRSVRRICTNVVHLISPHICEVVFDKADPCSRMLFVDKGVLSYGDPGDFQTEARTRLLEDWDMKTMIGPGQWICEPALWVEWYNCGRLVSDEYTCLYSITANELCEALTEDPGEYTKTVLYARSFMEELASIEQQSDMLTFEIKMVCLLPQHVEIKVTVESATGLADADSSIFGGRSRADPYCICKVFGLDKHSRKTRFKTKVVSNTSEPVWNETGSLQYSDIDAPLLFELWDKDTFSQDDYLGKGMLESTHFRESGFDGSIQISGPKVDGQLKVQVIVIDDRELSIVPSSSTRKSSKDSVSNSSSNLVD